MALPLARTDDPLARTAGALAVSGAHDPPAVRGEAVVLQTGLVAHWDVGALRCIAGPSFEGAPAHLRRDDGCRACSDEIAPACATPPFALHLAGLPDKEMRSLVLEAVQADDTRPPLHRVQAAFSSGFVLNSKRHLDASLHAYQAAINLGTPHLPAHDAPPTDDQVRMSTTSGDLPSPDPQPDPGHHPHRRPHPGADGDHERLLAEADGSSHQRAARVCAL